MQYEGDNFNDNFNDNLNDNFNDNFNDKYEFKTNVNKSLSEILDIPEIVIDEPNTWEPPKEHGLRNSIRIIPDYYNHPKTDYFNLDYFEIIKDDVRNMRILNIYQMKYIATLSSDEKNELFEIFNQCLHTINEVLLK